MSAAPAMSVPPSAAAVGRGESSGPPSSLTENAPVHGAGSPLWEWLPSARMADLTGF